MNNLHEELAVIYRSQEKDWPAFAEAVKGLTDIRSKSIQLANLKVFAQNNPARMRSTSAKIDAKSLNERPCFLCAANRPPEQRELKILDDKYVALVNPFPILPNHFTIVAKEHSKQDIVPALKDFLKLTSLLNEQCLLIFNGAKAGASAPDHLHFQVIPSANIPICKKIAAKAIKTQQDISLLEFAGVSYVHLFSQNEDWIDRKLV